MMEKYYWTLQNKEFRQKTETSDMSATVYMHTNELKFTNYNL